MTPKPRARCVAGSVALALFLVMAACGVSNDPREVADAFCYRYFIELNQAGALEIASGLAADKLRKEIELLKGSARVFEGGDREFHQHKPYIDYEMAGRTDQDADHVFFIYRITIEPRQGSERMEREIVLSTQRAEGRWTVNNYDIQDHATQE